MDGTAAWDVVILSGWLRGSFSQRPKGEGMCRGVKPWWFFLSRSKSWFLLL